MYTLLLLWICCVLCAHAMHFHVIPKGNLQLIRQVHAFHEQIFGGSSDVKFSLEAWLEYMDQGWLAIAQDEAGCIHSFIYAYKRPFSFYPVHVQTSQHVSADKFPAMHLWLAGTHPDARKKGYYKALLGMLKEYCRGEHIQYLTINTFEGAYPVMFESLMRHAVCLHRSPDPAMKSAFLMTV